MDKYRSFAELAQEEVEGVDYRIRKRVKKRGWAVMVPHGGGIEPGASEIGNAIAGRRRTFYAFEGLKPSGNGDLHITSTRFDEPQALAIAAKTARIITIHGESSNRRVVFVGGGHAGARKRLKAVLEARGFTVERHMSANLDGVTPSNICNRGSRGAGVQVELSAGLRRQCFQSMSTAGRKVRTAVFRRLVRGIRTFLQAEAR